MEDTVVESGSLGTPAAIEKSPLDFTDENPPPVITESGDIAICGRSFTRRVWSSRDRYGGLEKHIKNLEALFEAEADMKKAVEAKNVELVKELEGLHVQFLDLQVNNKQLSQQVSSLQAQVTEVERIKAAFEEFKKYEDDKLEKRCAEIDACLDELSIEIDEELYPHMLTAIAGRRWVIRHDLRLTVMKCAESLKLDRHLLMLCLWELQKLEKLKDTPLDLIMASLYLESDTGEDAPQWIRELCPNSSQLTIPVYLKVRDPKDPWGCKEEILLGDAIVTNVSRAEKKKKMPGGLAVLLADMATQTEDEASPRLIRSKSLPPMYHLDWT
ncbi:hypothetical protein Tco_0085408 [Tanacetum coccineum]